MPRLTRLALRLALLYLGVGWSLGAGMLVAKAWPIWKFMSDLSRLHGEILLIGFFGQFVMGVAFWILPRPGRQRPRSWLAWSAVALLNGSVLAMTIGPLVINQRLVHLMGWGGCLVAVVLFGLHVTKRLLPLRGR